MLWRAFGTTDITAAARLLRLKLEDRSIAPSLRREPIEDLRSSESEITLQSSLEAPLPEPFELVSECEEDGRRWRG